MPRSTDSPVARRLTAFGTTIVSDVEILGATGDPGPEGLPEVRLRLGHVSGLTPDVGEVVLERFWEDGSLGMRVRRLPDDSFAVESPGHGAFEITPSGQTVTLRDLPRSARRWHRPLLAQVLPIASTLAGHETLHASAAVMDGGAVAITAPSGTGKSSLIFNLVDRGARLLTDDVVALTPRDDGLIAHPGSPLANLSAEQHAMLSASTRERLGPPIGADDKLTFAVAGVSGPGAPLRALVLLRRSDDVSRPAVERVQAPGPGELLAATFLPHVVTRARAVRQLEVSALLARGVAILRFDAPASVPARDLASYLESALLRLGAQGGAE